jgi:hypothetical protein
VHFANNRPGIGEWSCVLVAVRAWCNRARISEAIVCVLHALSAPPGQYPPTPRRPGGLAHKSHPLVAKPHTTVAES